MTSPKGDAHKRTMEDVVLEQEEERLSAPDFKFRRETDDHGTVGTGVTHFFPTNVKAAMRISVIVGVPARSCSVGNWAAKDFMASLSAEGFTFSEID
jgi:hypothetical protein